MSYFKFMILTSLFVSTQAFYGSQILPFITSSDYTLSDLTEIGILQAVAKFFEKVRVPWKPTEPPPGSLSGISDITARKLYDKYYGDDVSSHKFQMVMDQIIRHNLKVDETYGDQAHWHFNAEKIREGNEKLKELRNNTLSILTSSSPDYDAARILIGQFLHIVQDFYSNTNWIDMTGGAAIYEDLGIPGKTLQGIAGPNVDTCTNCGLLMPCALFGALIKTNLLTSGYRNGQGNATKPQKDPVTNTQGKCSHGGVFDTTWNTSAATGGINKETNTLEYSPLFGDHNKAALLAIEHTRQFFINSGYGLLNEVGQDKFMKLLELYPGNPVAFVIDTSSMDMLDGVKKFVQDVIANVTGSVITPTNYILVTVDTSELQYFLCF
ncbi:hypothetical protein FSP39_012645 [Pinctada imbricata]|uniref:VWA7 N-terminal domain-containing protein n=1 Tax=Pinctada imbricata TaxID=66713 RepID=A0AA88YTF8_PINIB|nr:hypothetical protein FSP39_012645 [Pinctada imbricata]